LHDAARDGGREERSRRTAFRASFKEPAVKHDDQSLLEK
jgi:hypothetical protein